MIALTIIFVVIRIINFSLGFIPFDLIGYLNNHLYWYLAFIPGVFIVSALLGIIAYLLSYHPFKEIRKHQVVGLFFFFNIIEIFLAVLFLVNPIIPHYQPQYFVLMAIVNFIADLFYLLFEPRCPYCKRMFGVIDLPKRRETEMIEYTLLIGTKDHFKKRENNLNYYERKNVYQKRVKGTMEYMFYCKSCKKEFLYTNKFDRKKGKRFEDDKMGLLVEKKEEPKRLSNSDKS